MTAVRIQLSRRKGWRLPPDTVIVDRRTRWGNPLRVGMYVGYDAADVVRDFKRWLARDFAVRSYENVFGQPPTRAEIRKALRGKDLACWCALDRPCHADVLLGLANPPAASSKSTGDR